MPPIWCEFGSTKLGGRSVNQFTILGTKRPRRPDLIALVNRLPLGAIKLKNLTDEHADVRKAYEQIQTYKDETEPLFVYNAAMVIIDGPTARVGALTASREWFLPWGTMEGKDRPKLGFELEAIVRDSFRPDLLLDSLRYFVLFESMGTR